MKNLFAGSCALLALALGVLAWRQHLELIELRALKDDFATTSETDRATKEHASSSDQTKVTGETLSASDQDEKAVAPTAKPDAPKRAVAVAKPQKGPTKNEILAFLNEPETQRALAQKFREQVDARFGVFFKNLNVPEAQLPALRALLIEREGAAIDVSAAALAAGLKPKQEEMLKMVNAAQAETDRKLALALGPEGYKQFQLYESAHLFRGATSDLQRNLTRVAAPLDARQAENFTTGLAALAAGQFTPTQQQAFRSITQMEQTKQTLKQVEQLYKDRQNPPKPNKPAKKPNG
jgi:hypothetical protein